jgi:NAD(P)-dependent dehydrogenase (short-subunit alcohol dehydrogenase family)
MGLDTHSDRVTAIVTGGGSRTGRVIASALARWGWSIVVVYLDHQSRADETVAQIIDAGGTTVAVRADLADELDVQRLFAESVRAFGDVGVVVHTTADGSDLLREQAAESLQKGSVIVETVAANPLGTGVASTLRDRGITFGRIAPEEVLAFLGRWR